MTRACYPPAAYQYQSSAELFLTPPATDLTRAGKPKPGIG